MRLALATFLLVSAFIIIFTLLSLPPVLLVADVPQATTGKGGPQDSSPEGTSLAYAIIEAAGYVIVDSPEIADGVVIINPTLCNSYTLSRLQADLQHIHGTPYLVVFESPGCTAMRALLGVDAPTLLPQPVWALGLRGEVWPTMYAYTGLAIVASTGGYEGLQVLAVTLEQGYPAAYAWPRPDLSVAAYADGEAFTNRVILSFVQAGYTPEPMILLLLEQAGAAPGDRIYVPPYMYGEGIDEALQEAVAIPLNVREFVASLLEASVRLQESLLNVVKEAPLLVPAVMLLLAPAAWLASSLYMHARGRGGGGDERLEEPAPVEAVGLTRHFETVKMAVGKGRLELSHHETLRLLEALYTITKDAVRRAYGVDLDEAYRELLQGWLWWFRRRVLEITGDPEFDRLLFWLYVIYRKKVEEGSFFPLFVHVRKEVLNLYEALLPYLERLGVRLRGPRGLEYGRG